MRASSIVACPKSDSTFSHFSMKHQVLSSFSNTFWEYLTNGVESGQRKSGGQDARFSNFMSNFYDQMLDIWS